MFFSCWPWEVLMSEWTLWLIKWPKDRNKSVACDGRLGRCFVVSRLIWKCMMHDCWIYEARGSNLHESLTREYDIVCFSVELPSICIPDDRSGIPIGDQIVGSCCSAIDRCVFWLRFATIPIIASLPIITTRDALQGTRDGTIRQDLGGRRCSSWIWLAWACLRFVCCSTC